MGFSNITNPVLDGSDLLPRQFIAPYLDDIETKTKELIAQAMAAGLSDDQIQSIIDQVLQGADVVSHVEFTQSIQAEVQARLNGDQNISGDLLLLDDNFQIHRQTDIARWQNFYNTETMVLEQILKAAGLKLDKTIQEDITIGTPTNPSIISGQYGGLVTITSTNADNVSASLYLNEEKVYATDGIVESGVLTKSIIVESGDVVYSINADSLIYTPTIPDDNYVDKDEIDTKFNIVENDITTLESQVSNLVSDVDDISTDMIDNTTSIADLQAADLNNVKLTGDQTINGVKTFNTYMRTKNLVPIDNTGVIGSASALYANGYFQTLNVSTVPILDNAVPNKGYVDSIDKAITQSLAKIAVELLNIENDFNTHKETDISRWENAYMTERRTLEQNVYAMGGMEDVTALHTITVPNYEVLDTNGGIVDIETINIDGKFVSIKINDELVYSSEGILDDIPLKKSFLVNPGDTIVITCDDPPSMIKTANITPIVLDPNNPISILRRTMSDQIVALQQQILAINASIENKVLDSTQTIDIEAATQAAGGWTVPSNLGLGGVITYEGIDALLFSTGWIDINGIRVYDYGGLLGLKIGVLKETKEVSDGDLIETGGLNSITFTPYKPRN